jgi:hypothetical protein
LKIEGWIVFGAERPEFEPTAAQLRLERYGLVVETAATESVKPACTGFAGKSTDAFEETRT